MVEEKYNMKRMTKDAGFTLIELLVVVAIIGILAAIAIPQFAEYRARGFDSRALSDLRNAATAEEAYFADNEEYVACSVADQAGDCIGTLPAFAASAGVNLTMESADGTTFEGSSEHPQGSLDGDCYTWDSTAGGLTGRGACL
jgi:prepilin-type N-terminal cleavage/methylation domain-containing protein